MHKTYAKENLFKFLEQEGQNLYFDLLIDNADSMRNELVDEIREIDSFRRMGKRYIQIVLFGTSKMAPMGWPLTKSFSLHPFNYEDVQKMIEYRLNASGCPQLFSEEAIEKIYRLTEGVPGRIVNWCRLGLEYTASRGRKFIDGRDIDEIMGLKGLPPLE